MPRSGMERSGNGVLVGVAHRLAKPGFWPTICTPFARICAHRAAQVRSTSKAASVAPLARRH